MPDDSRSGASARSPPTRPVRSSAGSAPPIRRSSCNSPTPTTRTTSSTWSAPATSNWRSPRRRSNTTASCSTNSQIRNSSPSFPPGPDRARTRPAPAPRRAAARRDSARNVEPTTPRRRLRARRLRCPTSPSRQHNARRSSRSSSPAPVRRSSRQPSRTPPAGSAPSSWPAVPTISRSIVLAHRAGPLSPAAERFRSLVVDQR